MNAITDPPADYRFTNEWFAQNIPAWDLLLPRFEPKKVLEIGSYEGRSACYLIEKFTVDHPLEVHCIDTWAGGLEHDKAAMSAVEERFDHNIRTAVGRVKHPARVIKHKKLSHLALATLLTPEHAATFDVVYVDGSHQAPDVLSDAVLGFHLLRVGGLMIFDDYVWSMEPPGQQDAFNMPKPAIDAFLNIFQRKMLIMRGVPIYQLYVIKFAA